MINDESKNTKKDNMEQLINHFRIVKLFAYIILGLVIITMILVIVQSANAFNLPKLKITYIKPKQAQAQIVGKTNGLPVLTVNFVNKPLWRVLQTISSKTGYVFSTKHINLGKKITLKGRYNFADILAKIFNGKNEDTSVNIKTKLIKVKEKL